MRVWMDRWVCHSLDVKLTGSAERPDIRERCVSGLPAATNWLLGEDVYFGYEEGAIQ